MRKVPDTTLTYRKILNVTGEGRFTIPFALNDPCGIWRVVITDGATGVKKEIRIKLNRK